MCDGDVRPDMLVPFENLDGATCEDIVDVAKSLEDNSEECSSFQYVEALCCPSAASTCSICKGTKLLADVEVISSTGATFTCGQFAFYAANLEATSVDCTSYHKFEEFCCPDVFIPPPPSSSPPIGSSTPPPTYSSSRLVFAWSNLWNRFL